MKKIIITTLLFCGLIVNASGFAQQKKVLDIRYWITKKGTRVYFVPVSSIPMVDITLAFQAGSARDGKQFGLATLTSGLLDQGAADLSANDIAKRFDNIGAQYSSDVARDIATVSLRTLTGEDYFQPAIDTFRLLLSKPSFPEKDFEREKQTQLLSLKQQQQMPTAIASNTFYKQLYGNHAYAHSTYGTPETVSKFTDADVKKFYKEHYLAHGAVMAIVGDLTEKQARALSEVLTRDLPNGRLAKKLDPITITGKPQNKAVKFPSTQTNIRMGQLGITRTNPDYFALKIGNYTLGGGALISRLFKQVREKRGLSYSVYSRFIPMEQRGPFLIGLATKNSTVKEAINVIHDVLNNFISKGPSDAELTAAKKNITGGFPLLLDSNQKIAGNILMLGVYGLPIDYLDTYIDNVNAVTQSQVRTAFQKHVQPEKMITIQVGQQTK